MTQSPATLRLGTRASRLALAQAHMVQGLLAARGHDIEIAPIKTSGDRILDRSLADAGGKGLFTKELEEALQDRRIDFAVHSMKDVPTALPDGLALGAILPREDVRDAFIGRTAARLMDLPHGARVGTSSVRRVAQVKRARPDLETVLLRGNIDTRLRKLADGEYDAILLALAGLKRTGMQSHVTDLMPVADWLPALAQGAIGIELRADDAAAMAAIAPLNDRDSAVAVSCERAFQAALDGSCRTPIAGWARVEREALDFRGEVLSPDGAASDGARFTLALGADAMHDAARAGHEAGHALRPRVQAWLAL